MTSFSPKKRGADVRHHVVLLVPAGSDYAAAGARIAADLTRAGCRQVSILHASDAKPKIGSATPIALGNFTDNPFIRDLYYAARDFSDSAWPGKGGWAIRSVASATAEGADAVLLSVSESGDAGSVAAAFGNILEGHGLDLPWLLQVEQGRWRGLYHDAVTSLLPTADASLDVVGGGSGDWDYMMAIGRVGVLAVKTGEENLILRFVTELVRFVRVRFSERELEDPIQIHGFLRNLLRPFAMLEHHPVLSEALRLEALEGLLALYRSTEGAANPALLDDAQHMRVRQNHGTRTAIDVYDGGLYFWREHGLEEGREWALLAARYFEAQMVSSKPVCDSWGHQWVASLYNTAEFALMSGRLDYFSSSPFLDAADRALIAHTNLESGPLFYLLLAAAVTGNDDYLVLSNNKDSRPPWIEPIDDSADDREEMTPEANLVRRVLEQIGADEFGRAWITGSESRRPERLTGIRVAPVARLFYDSLETYESYAPTGIYHRDVPFASTFDKIAYRTGWDEKDAYLLLDGISGGSHSYQDANCIIRFTQYGKSWLGGPQYGRWTTGTVREQNGVSVCCDGEGAGCEARYARLHQAETVDGVGLIRTELDVPGVARWIRQIVAHPRGWILVCDEVVAAKSGEFSVQAQWNLLGDVTEGDDEPGAQGVRSVQDAACLTLRQAGGDRCWLTPIYAAGRCVSTRWNVRRSQRLMGGESLLMATLLNVADTLEEVAPMLIMRGQTLSVEAPDQTVVTIRLDGGVDEARVSGNSIQLTASGAVSTQSPRVSHETDRRLEPAWCQRLGAPVSAIEIGADFCLVGTREGDVTRLSSEKEVAFHLKGDEEVSAILAMEDGGFLTGSIDGSLRRYDRNANLLWQHRVEWQPMNWDNWTRRNCAVLGLAVGDFEGEQRIAVGCADRHVYGFTMEGEPLWRSPCQWGAAAHVAIAAVGAEGESRILVGMERPAIHAWCRVYDGEGHYLRAFQRSDVVSWSIPSWMTGMEVADLNGDGQPEVIVGMDTNHRQLVVYKADGEILWDADVGSSVTCVAQAHGEVYVGTEGGWVHRFDCSGDRVWSRDAQRPVRGLAPLEPERTLVALDDGRVYVIGQSDSVWPGAGMGSTGSTAYWPGQGLLVGSEGTGGIALFR